MNLCLSVDGVICAHLSRAQARATAGQSHLHGARADSRGSDGSGAPAGVRPRCTGLALWTGSAGRPGGMSLNESSRGRKDRTWTFVPDGRSVAAGPPARGQQDGDTPRDTRSKGRGELCAYTFPFGPCVRQGPTGVCWLPEGKPGPTVHLSPD